MLLFDKYRTESPLGDRPPQLMLAALATNVIEWSDGRCAVLHVKIDEEWLLLASIGQNGSAKPLGVTLRQESNEKSAWRPPPTAHIGRIIEKGDSIFGRALRGFTREN